MWLLVSMALSSTIVVLSLLHGNAWIVRTTPRPLQKLLHVVFYAALAASLLMAQSSFHVDPRFAPLLVGLGAIGLGAMLQWLQAFQLGRFARISDLALDASGVIVGVAIWLVICHE
jgi:VanZ family protein